MFGIISGEVVMGDCPSYILRSHAEKSWGIAWGIASRNPERCFTSVEEPHYLLNNTFAASSSLRFSSSSLGYARSSDSSVSTSTVDTTSRVNHLLSAGTTYHGACSVAVLPIISS